ncbi:MAG TPA: hypothetical protein P5560_01695 [Thermotogota bacterium]|nr:hypothetical protein [Thermotogota bacterium]
MNSTEWMDRSTRDFCGVEKLLKRLEFACPLGGMHLQARKVFQKGQEKQCREHFARFRSLEALESSSREQIHSACTVFRSITESLQRLEKGGNMGVVDFFEIKRFVFHHNALVDLIPQGMRDAFSFRALQPAWKKLDPHGKNRVFFSIESEYAEELRKLLNENAHRKNRVFEQITRALEKKYEIPLKGRKEFVLSRQDIRTGVLRQSALVLVKKENTFSVHFEVRGDDRILQLEKERAQLENELEREEHRYLAQLQGELSPYAADLWEQFWAIGELDFCLAALAFKDGTEGCFPVILEQPRIRVQRGENLEVRDACREQVRRYDPLEGDFCSGVNLLIGANMGGKTTALRTLGQLVFLVSLGIPVPAKSLQTGLFDRVVSVFRDREEEGLSGFGSEVQRCSRVFEPGCFLALVDEFGSSTNPPEGESLAMAVVENLDKRKDQCTLFVSHFPRTTSLVAKVFLAGVLRLVPGEELSNLDELYDRVDHSLQPVQPNVQVQGALLVAGALGFPPAIVQRAQHFFAQGISQPGKPVEFEERKEKE